MENLERTNLALNISTLRHQALLRALCALAEVLDDDTKQRFAQRTRERIAELLEDAGAENLLTPEMDALVTLDLNTLLEAVGEAPASPD